MAIFNVDKIVIDDLGKIHIYQGKISYIFGEFAMLEEMANRDNPKTRDIPIQAVCRHILKLPRPALENLKAFENTKVEY